MENIRKIILSFNDDKKIEKLVCVFDNNIEYYTSENFTQSDMQNYYYDCIKQLKEQYQEEIEGLDDKDIRKMFIKKRIIVKNNKRLICNVSEFNDPKILKIKYDDGEETIIKASSISDEEYTEIFNNTLEEIATTYNIESSNIEDLKTKLNTLGIYEIYEEVKPLENGIRNLKINKKFLYGLLGTSAVVLLVYGGIKASQNNDSNSKNEKATTIDMILPEEPTATPYVTDVKEEPIIIFDEVEPTAVPTPEPTAVPTVVPTATPIISIPGIVFPNESNIFPEYEEVEGKYVVLYEVNGTMFVTDNDRTNFYDIRNKNMDSIENNSQSNIPITDKGYYIYFENMFNDYSLSDKAFVKYFSMYGNQIIKNVYKNNQIQCVNKYAKQSCYEVVRCIRDNQPLSVIINGQSQQIYYNDLSNKAKETVLNIAWSNYTVLNSSPDLYKLSDYNEEANIPEINYNNEILTKSDIADILITAYEELSMTK